MSLVRTVVSVVDLRSRLSCSFGRSLTAVWTQLRVAFTSGPLTHTHAPDISSLVLKVKVGRLVVSSENDLRFSTVVR